MVTYKQYLQLLTCTDAPPTAKRVAENRGALGTPGFRGGSLSVAVISKNLFHVAQDAVDTLLALTVAADPMEVDLEVQGSVTRCEFRFEVPRFRI